MGPIYVRSAVPGSVMIVACTCVQRQNKAGIWAVTRLTVTCAAYGEQHDMTNRIGVQQDHTVTLSPAAWDNANHAKSC